MNRLLLFCIALCLATCLQAQIINEVDETKLYAESKQVNQFFRRFNGEEDEKGKRFSPSDKQYRSTKLRKKYLEILFDGSNAGMTGELKNEFVKYILDKPEATVLNFHGGNWFSEVQTTFASGSKPQSVILFMELEKAQMGTKWVIQKAYSENFRAQFVRDTSRVGRFLHPMSHELDFMNLRKAFANPDSISQFTVKRFVPDHLSVLMYEVRKGSMTFKSVDQVKFHFFQIEGWYFEISEFNRPGYNTGWLISNLVKLKGKDDPEILRKYLYHESR